MVESHSGHLVLGALSARLTSQTCHDSFPVNQYSSFPIWARTGTADQCKWVKSSKRTRKSPFLSVKMHFFHPNFHSSFWLKGVYLGQVRADFHNEARIVAVRGREVGQTGHFRSTPKTTLPKTESRFFSRTTTNHGTRLFLVGTPGKCYSLLETVLENLFWLQRKVEKVTFLGGLFWGHFGPLPPHILFACTIVCTHLLIKWMSKSCYSGSIYPRTVGFTQWKHR